MWESKFSSPIYFICFPFGRYFILESTGVEHHLNAYNTAISLYLCVI